MKNYIAAASVFAFCTLGASANATNWLGPCVQALYLEPSSSAGVSGGRGSKQSPDCQRSTFARTSNNVRIWRCHNLDNDQARRDGEAGNGFIIQQASAPLQYVSHDILPGNERKFEVIEVDLNGDASREHILAVWDAQSNGMGVHSWTIYVFDTRWKLMKRFEDVSDWARSSLVAAPAGRRGCDIAITSYETISPPRGGDFTALRARFYTGRTTPTTAALMLQEAIDRPTLERRYSQTFERERTNWFSRGKWQWRGDVANWLNNPATQSKPATPPRSGR
jgi:hypothetical protein